VGIEEAREAIRAELEHGGPIDWKEIPIRLSGHSHEDIELAVALMEGDKEIIVFRETDDAANPYSFSGLTLSR
jgi:hypothetical protein